MTAPLIGITMHAAHSPARAELDTLVAEIADCVVCAGGLPVLIPAGLSDATVAALLPRLDGVLFSGGGDIDPARYGAPWHPSVGGVDAERDRLELELARLVVSREVPVFGICRGAQVINVALGGTLYTTVEQHPNALRHDYNLDIPGDLRPHAVQIAEDSVLSGIIGQQIVDVNSLHHQACRDIAPGLRVVAHAPDGLIEAFEVPGHPFALAVQWHPEAMPAAPEMQRLFAAFVAAARRDR